MFNRTKTFAAMIIMIALMSTTVLADGTEAVGTKTQSPVILVDTDLKDSLTNYLVRKKVYSSNVVIIGDKSSVSDRLYDSLKNSSTNEEKAIAKQGVISLSIDDVMAREKKAGDIGDDSDAAIKKADEIIASVIKPGMTDFDKELALHDYVITHAKYDTINVNKGTIPDVDYTSEGILVNGVGVCEGFTKAMNLLLNRVGIKCVTVVAPNINHSWNIVEVGGHCYHLDITWDDLNTTLNGGGKAPIYDYFNVTDNEMEKTGREWNRTLQPVCNDVTYSYKDYMYCKDNNIPLVNRTRVISGTVSLPSGQLADNDISIQVSAFKTVYRGDDPEDSKVYDNYECENSIVIPKGASFATYNLVVPAFKDGFIVYYTIPNTNNKYKPLAAYKDSGMTDSMNGSYIDVSEDNKVVNLTVLPIDAKNQITYPSSDPGMTVPPVNR